MPTCPSPLASLVQLPSQLRALSAGKLHKPSTMAFGGGIADECGLLDTTSAGRCVTKRDELEPLRRVATGISRGVQSDELTGNI